MNQLPQNLDAERSILGAALSAFHQEALPKLSALTMDDFAGPDHKRIWQATVSLLQKGVMPDPVLLKNELPDVSMIDLLQLQESACVLSSVDYYMKLLKKNEHGRRLYFASRNTLAALTEGEDYDKIEESLLTGISKHTSNDETTTLDECGDVDQMLAGEEKQPFVKFGIPDLDAATGGIRNGEVCFVAGRASMGKSVIAIDSTVHSAEAGWFPFYGSLEMAKKQLWYRILSYQSGVSLRKFRDQLFNEYDARDIRRAKGQLQKVMSNVRVNTVAKTPGKLMQAIRLEQLSGHGNYLIIDHGGRMQSDGKGRGRYEDATDIAHRIKDLAISMNIPVLCLWQLSRKTEMKQDKKPTMEDLRDSGHVEEVADMIVLLYRDSYYDKSIPMEKAMVTIDLAKARDGGQLGEIQVPWKRLISRFHAVPAMKMGKEVTGITFD